MCNFEQTDNVSIYKEVIIDEKSPDVKTSSEEAEKYWSCAICGYNYEGDELPKDYICPICEHPASDFVKVEVSSEEAEKYYSKGNTYYNLHCYDEAEEYYKLALEKGHKDAEYKLESIKNIKGFR